MKTSTHMKIKKLIQSAALLSFLTGGGLVANADSPLLQLGENSSAYVFADAGLTWCDNIFYASNGQHKVDDFVYFLAAGVVGDVGKDGSHHLNFSFKETFSNYVDNDDLNSQLANFSVSYSYDPQKKLRLGLFASFTQFAQNDNVLQYDSGSPEYLRDLIRRDQYYVSADINYQISSRVSADIGFNYYNEHFRNHRDVFNDRQTFSIPVSVFYQVTEKHHLGLSYSWSHTEISRTSPYNNYDPGAQDSHFFGISTKGALTSKLTLRGNAGVGFQSFSGRGWLTTEGYYHIPNDAHSTANFTLVLDYSADKYRLALSSGRNFNLGGQAQSYTNTHVRLNATTYLSLHWYLSAYAAYYYQEYSKTAQHKGGDDNLVSAGINLSFLPNRYWRLGAGYTHIRDVSNRIRDFSSNSITLSATLKY
ncbi:MAG: hypothetical protein LBT53_08820 [Puniceicoccales bacterium]|jgi:hypothetical protein|nr:hypothetical protein [Puniceicoccales bacterium]